MIIYLLRHGQSKWQINESSSNDSQLTELGIKQSVYLNKCVLNLCKNTLLDNLIYVSPYKRSLQTVFSLGKKFTTVPYLIEAPFHVASRLPNFDFPQFYSKENSIDIEYIKFKAALREFMSELILTHSSQNIFLYTHGGVIKTILRILHDNDALCYTINNCSLTKIRWYRARWHIDAINDVSYIPKKYVT